MGPLIINSAKPTPMSSNPTIAQMNYVIAVFRSKSFSGSHITDYTHETAPRMQYHCSWNRLMPVVEKIETMSDLIIKKVWISINGCTCAIWSYFDVQDVLRYNMPNDCFKIKVIDKTKLIATHSAVYQFIQWYNKQKEVNNER